MENVTGHDLRAELQRQAGREQTYPTCLTAKECLELLDERDALLRERGRATFRIMRDRIGFHVVIGPWAARFSWDRSGRFGNGSRWFSGWHRWERAA